VKDATVQGSEAPTSIANGIHHHDLSEDVDAIIVSRSGGSDSNLWAFNTGRVAEAMFTAIGHTDDRLIADQVASVATITPTVAGEYIVNSREEFLAGETKPLEQQLDAAYETFQQEHEHEQELAEAVDEADTPEGLPPIYYTKSQTIRSVCSGNPWSAHSSRVDGRLFECGDYYRRSGH